jgi:hypothetical protein
MTDDVECRSDWEYAQRPLAFTWQGQRLVVQEVIAEQRTPEGKHFLVHTSQDGSFELIYNEQLDQWSIQPQPAKESA